MSLGSTIQCYQGSVREKFNKKERHNDQRLNEPIFVYEGPFIFRIADYRVYAYSSK